MIISSLATEPMTSEAPSTNGHRPPVLLPQHLAMIKASGISLEVVAARGYRSVTKKSELRELGFGATQCLVPTLLIPVFNAAGEIATYQHRPDSPRMNTAGKLVKYETKVKSVMVLDVNPLARKWLGDPRRPVFITEGIRKGDAAVAQELCCISLLGVWNWKGTNTDGGKTALADWDYVALKGRQLYIVFDSDVMTKPEVHEALKRLKAFLEQRGATVAVIYLPSGDGGAKTGMDDYLAAGHGVDDLLQLASPVLKGPEATQAEGDTIKLLDGADSIRLLHPGQDVVDGVLWYGVPVRDADDKADVVLISSNRQHYQGSQLPGGLRLRPGIPDPSTVSKDLALRWIKGSLPEGSVAAALDGLAEYFSRYVRFRDPVAPLWLAAWALGTWCYRAFDVFPYVSIRSSEKRCGKSRLMKLVARVGFNSSPVSAHASEAMLYRTAARTSGVQLLDEVELLRGNQERFDALIGVLNVGFERGGVVVRLEKREDQFVDIPYEVYAPRMLAGLAGLKETLEDRSIPLYMVRRLRSEPIARITAETGHEAAHLRELCAVACLGHISEILETVEWADHALEKIDDRAADLWAPLMTLALVADSEDGGDRAKRVLEAATVAGGHRDADAEDGTTLLLVETLLKICDGPEKSLVPAALLVALRQEPGFESIKSRKSLATKLMNPIGLYSRQLWHEGKNIGRHYTLDKATLVDLHDRYSGSTGSAP